MKQEYFCETIHLVERGLIIRLILTFLCDLRWTPGGSSSLEKPTPAGTKLEQWSMTLIEKPRGFLCSEVDIECSACACRAKNRE